MSEYIERTSEMILAANAGARAIENTKRYHGAFYTRDVFAANSAEIAYLQAAKVLRDIEDAPTVQTEVRRGKWECGEPCPCCGEDRFKGLDADVWADWEPPYCPNCGARMDLEDGNG